MITFGTSALFTSEISLGQRAPDAGAAIGQYIKDWDAPIEAAYADTRGLGERLSTESHVSIDTFMDAYWRAG